MTSSHNTQRSDDTLRLEGMLVSSAGQRQGAVEISTRSGLITHVGEAHGDSDLDLAGCLIFAGFGDVHIHAREDASGQQTYKETFRSMSAAAVHGGVAHVSDMPNNVVAPVDDARYDAKSALTHTSDVHVTLYAGIGPHTQPLARDVPYKAFMGPSVGDLFFTSAAELEQAIARYVGANVSFHCEDPEVLAAHRDQPTHETRRPAHAEVSATELALRLIEKYALRGKLCHYSTRDGLPKIIAARQRGVRVTAEATPHHLYFDTSMLTDENRLMLQMNPPLRAPEDRVALLEALRRGDVDYIATDHAPHTLAEKAEGISGVPHLDTYGAFATWLIVEHGFTPETIARVCAENPGEFVRPYLPASLGRGFGRIEPGFAGSLTVLDLGKPTLVRREDQRTLCGWSPFEGITFPGSVRATVVAGRVFSGNVSQYESDLR